METNTANEQVAESTAQPPRVNDGARNQYAERMRASRHRQKAHDIQSVHDVLEEDGAMAARLLTVIRHFKNNQDTPLFLGPTAIRSVLKNGKNKTIFDEGKPVFTWNVHALAFSNKNSALLVDLLHQYDTSSQALKEQIEFIPGLSLNDKNVLTDEQYQKAQELDKEIKTILAGLASKIKAFTQHLEKK